jgi:transcription antitermination factor NusG
VKKVVGGTDGPWPVSPEIVDLVQSRESGGVIPAPSDEFREGDVVEVAHGPLAGLSGIYESPEILVLGMYISRSLYRL